MKKFLLTYTSGQTEEVSLPDLEGETYMADGVTTGLSMQELLTNTPEYVFFEDESGLFVVKPEDINSVEEIE